MRTGLVNFTVIVLNNQNRWSRHRLFNFSPHGGRKDRSLPLWRVWKITNLISGDEHNGVPAVTGSELVAYSPVPTHKTVQCFCVDELQYAHCAVTSGLGYAQTCLAMPLFLCACTPDGGEALE